MLIIFLLLMKERFMCFLDQRKPDISCRRSMVSIRSMIFLTEVTAAWLKVVTLCSKFAVAVTVTEY